MQIIRPRYGYLSLLVTGVLFPAVLVVRRVWFGLDWFYENVPVLQSIQTIGGFFALSAGVILFIIGVSGADSSEEQSRRERRYIPWVTCALLSMGSLMALSSALPLVDGRYLAVESVSQLLGGLFCLMVWFPYRWSKNSVVRWVLPIFAFLSATAFGVFVMFSNKQFVSLLNGSQFGSDYVLLTQIAGALFFFAFIRFVVQFKRYGRSSDLIFAQFTLLSAASDLVFERFHLWGPIWWTWHLLQFVSLFVTFLYMFVLNYRQEKALQESEARFNQLSNVVFEGVLLTENGRVFDTNKAFEELTGVSQVQCIGRDVDSFFSAPIKRTFDGVSVEGRLKRSDGSLIDVEVRRRHGGSEGTDFFTVRDVSQRKQHDVELERLASELERSNCELENFAHLASHDLREPLRMVSSFLT